MHFCVQFPITLLYFKTKLLNHKLAILNGRNWGSSFLYFIILFLYFKYIFGIQNTKKIPNRYISILFFCKT